MLDEVAMFPWNGIDLRAQIWLWDYRIVHVAALEDWEPFLAPDSRMAPALSGIKHILAGTVQFWLTRWKKSECCLIGVKVKCVLGCGSLTLHGTRFCSYTLESWLVPSCHRFLGTAFSQVSGLTPPLVIPPVALTISLAFTVQRCISSALWTL